MEHKVGTHRTLTGLLRRTAHGVYGFLYEKEPEFFPAYEVKTSDHASTPH